MDTRGARVLLVETADRVLTGFPPSLSRKAERALEKLGVTPLVGHTVTDVGLLGVTIRLWTWREREDVGTHRHLGRRRGRVAGLRRRSRPRSDAEVDRAGRLDGTGPDLTLPGHPEVFAIGDMVRIARSDGTILALPGVAPVAMQEGRYAARVIRSASQWSRHEGVQVRRQGQPGHHRPVESRRRHQGSAARRLPCLGHMARRASLLSDRIPEPAARLDPLDVQLLHARPRRSRLITNPTLLSRTSYRKGLQPPWPSEAGSTLSGGMSLDNDTF